VGIGEGVAYEERAVIEQIAEAAEEAYDDDDDFQDDDSF